MENNEIENYEEMGIDYINTKIEMPKDIKFENGNCYYTGNVTAEIIEKDELKKTKRENKKVIKNMAESVIYKFASANGIGLFNGDISIPVDYSFKIGEEDITFNVIIKGINIDDKNMCITYKIIYDDEGLALNVYSLQRKNGNSIACSYRIN